MANYTELNNLAIVACPGGETFADQTISHLRENYTEIFESLYSKLSETYSKKLTPDDFNFMYAMMTGNPHNDNCTSKFNIPKFKTDINFTKFSNGEFKAEIKESIRGKDVYIFQDIENTYELSVNGCADAVQFSVNDHLMALFVTIDAVRHAGAGRISLVLPTYPYSRQHKKKGREGLTASMLSHFYEDLGVSQIITLDLHSIEIENAFRSAKLLNLHASYQIINELLHIINLSKNSKENLTVVSPDIGAIARNKFYAEGLNTPLAILYKERDYSIVSRDALHSNIKKDRHLLGTVKNRNVFLADDMLGTGGTLLSAMTFLKENGAQKIVAAISLPLFTKEPKKTTEKNKSAIDNFDDAYKKGLFYRIIGTNAVYHTNADLKEKEWYVEADVSMLFAKVIQRLHENGSISDLLENRGIIEKLLEKAYPNDYK